MARYIDANKLIEAILDSLGKDTHRTIEASLVHRQEHHHLLHIITKQPTADVEEVKHGEWSIGKEPSGSVYAYCSACKRKMSPSCYGYARCALCGAKMDGGNEE